MKVLETFEHKKGNKLIFRQHTSDIPSLGSLVLVEKDNPKKDNSKEKKLSEIGKIIDIFGPVKEPWVVVNLFKDMELQTDDNSFYWKKEQQFKKKSGKDFRKSARDFRKSSKDFKKPSRSSKRPNKKFRKEKK